MNENEEAVKTMRCTILLHSTTGNTRLVARYARAHIERHGHTCEIFDVAKRGEAPSLDEVDLLGVACPTMYFRPTYVMERFVARLPVAAPRPKPAFLLATNGGDTGAHLALLAEQLAHKDYVVLGGHAVPFSTNWPPRRALVEKAAVAQPLAELVADRVSGARPYLSLLFPDVKGVSPSAPAKLDTFLDGVLDAYDRGRDRGTWVASRTRDLPLGSRPATIAGRLMQLHMMRRATSISIDPARCSRCGTCVLVCPTGCLSQRSDDEVPTVGEGCSGCWTCFNHCPDGAMSGAGARAGAGRYRGPSRRDREVMGVRGATTTND